ncbi:MAG: NAD(P)/FAD-dependent oxidoreductase [Oscillospiraceae bacterium]|nr:NAD(P)/FAD-dependent oxidoreductase [Oscillospiraceae bacterium]
MRKYDVIVIGGGLLGCFAARSLVRYNLKVALLEKREDLCTGISRANTAIVYSGCDTKSDSLKTTLCVKAAQDFSRLCSQLGVRYNKCGSLMISFGGRGDEVLGRKFEKGTVNGVRGMKMLSGPEVLALEGNIASHVRGGLYVPETGTVMPWELCLAAAENAAANGAEISLNTEVLGIEPGRRDEEGYVLQTNAGEFKARAVINCAGMSADSVLALAGDPAVKIVPTLGEYFILDTKASGHIGHVIFHEPEEKGKGLTLVPTVDGNILVGPTERPFNQGESEFFETAKEGANLLRSLVSEVIPSLPMEHVINSFGAVRPNPFIQTQNARGAWVTENKSVNDLCIIESEDGKMISLVGIKTPGLTCSNEIGLYIAEKISERLGAAQNAGFNPQREPTVRLGEMKQSERAELIHSNPSYGKIICRCRGISEGEIVDAIHRSPGAVTLDGVKRRAGTGSGRCQGGFCSQRLVEILARELGCSTEAITKHGGDSWVVAAK